MRRVLNGCARHDRRKKHGKTNSGQMGEVGSWRNKEEEMEGEY